MFSFYFVKKLGHACGLNCRVLFFCVMISLFSLPASLASANTMYPVAGSSLIQQTSVTGFSWWRVFSHQRDTYRVSAVHCLSIRHGASVCWTHLMAEMPRASSTALLTHRSICPAVRFNVELYWHDLSRVVRYASAHGHLPGMHSALFLRATLSLQNAEYGLQEMADNGICVTGH